MEIDKIGLGQGETLTKAFSVLAAASKRPVTLIIDEAQHSQVSEEGRQALYAVKAARDALNASSGPGFRLLATGSNADKLATLVDDNDQAFYQAPLIPLPPLGEDYLAWLRERLKVEPKPSLPALAKAFEMCNHRTEPLRAIFREMALNVALDAVHIDEVFEQSVHRSLAREKENFFQHVNGLGPLDAAVLKVMARDGKRFAPYTKGSFVDYKIFVQAVTGEIPVDVSQSSVQQALERLRAEKFIWRAARGAYFIEDPQQAAWISEHTQSHASKIEELRLAVLIDSGV